MVQTLTIALAQLDFPVGDLAGNVARLCQAHAQAIVQGADLLVAPEMAITGYPAEDLILTPAFQAAAIDAATRLARECAHGPAILTGGLWADETGLYNAALLMEGGEITRVQRKHCLPNTGVFDEERVFAHGALPEIWEFRGTRIGLMVCEDLWHANVPAHLAAQKPDLWLVINASPFEVNKRERRLARARAAQKLAKAPLLYLNTVGGQDELVFDGGSFMLDAAGQIAAQWPEFAEAQGQVSSFHHIGWEVQDAPNAELLDEEAQRWAAITLGLRAYVEKNGAKQVLLGLSGGIDSALVATLAADALGAERVRAVMLPSPYTSQESLDQAAALAANLGIRLDTMPIESGMRAVEATLAPLATPPAPLMLENLQSRLRGLLLMALSNQTGALLLTTGNKSELAVGYATLYGDMCGAYNPLKDLYKTEVYALARWRNRDGEVIPETTITRAPSAELRENQTDQDSLPPYEALDAILRLLIEERQPPAAIVALGHEEAAVARVAKLLKYAEFKRRQAPPGPKLGPLSFGRDWRMPLSSGFSG